MNKPTSTECVRFRDRITAWTLEGRPPAGLTRELKAHLEICPSCALYAEGLAALPAAVEGEPLYTPALRARTLAGLPHREQGRSSLLLWLVPGALALNLAASLLLPALLVHPLFQSLSPHRWFAMGASALAAYTIGMAVAGLTLVALRSQPSKEEIHA